MDLAMEESSGEGHERFSFCKWLEFWMVNLENMHTGDIIQTESIIFRNLYAYTYAYMYVTTVNEKRRCEFEKEQGGPCGRLWREDKEEINDVIIL